MVFNKALDFFGKSFVFNVTLNGRENYSEQGLLDSAKYFKNNAKSLEQMIKIICELDLGLNSVELDEVELKTSEGQIEKLYLGVWIVFLIAALLIVEYLSSNPTYQVIGKELDLFMQNIKRCFNFIKENRTC